MTKKTLRTSIIEIEYDKNTTNRANELQIIIKNNQLLFKTLLAGYTKIKITDLKKIKEKEAGILYISNKLDLNHIIISIMEEYCQSYTETSSAQDNNEFIISTLIALIVRQSVEKQEVIYDNLDEELKETMQFPIYEILAYYYLKYEKQELTSLLDYITNMTDERKKELSTWINTPNNKLGLLNYILEKRSTTLSEEEPFLYSNIKELNDRLNSNIQNYHKYINLDEKTYEFSKLTKEELEELFKEFLVTIDPSLTLLDVYINLLKRNKIIYCHGSITKNDWHVTHDSKKTPKYNPSSTYIVAPIEGNINDFRRLAHEFAHYLTYSSSLSYPDMPSTLKEFASISLELISLGFLYKKGYSEEEIKELRKKRFLHEISQMYVIYPNLAKLDNYLKTGPITYEKLRAELETKISTLKTSGSKSKDSEKMENSFDETAINDIINRKIDNANKELIMFYNDCLKGYSYVMGDYLASISIKRIPEDKTIIPFIIDASFYQMPLTIQDVFEKLGINTDGLSFENTTLNKSSETVKIKTKFM